MSIKKFQLPEENFKRINSLDDSIAQWSVEYTKNSLNLRKLESGINSFYEARRQIVNDHMTSIGIDPTKVVRLDIIDDAGNCVVTSSQESEPVQDLGLTQDPEPIQ